jgi:hypothetical protein
MLNASVRCVIPSYQVPHHGDFISYKAATFSDGTYGPYSWTAIKGSDIVLTGEAVIRNLVARGLSIITPNIILRENIEDGIFLVGQRVRFSRPLTEARNFVFKERFFSTVHFFEADLFEIKTVDASTPSEFLDYQQFHRDVSYTALFSCPNSVQPSVFNSLDSRPIKIVNLLAKALKSQPKTVKQLSIELSIPKKIIERVFDVYSLKFVKSIQSGAGLYTYRDDLIPPKPPMELEMWDGKYATVAQISKKCGLSIRAVNVILGANPRLYRQTMGSYPLKWTRLINK